MLKDTIQKGDINLEEIHKILLAEKNPFQDTIVGDPQQNIIDVESINSELTNIILNSLEKIRNREKRSDFILVQGEAGLGKTHFLSRMRKKAKQCNFIFVDLPPLGDISRIYSHIFQHLFINLSWKRPQDRYSPLFELIAYILSEKLIEFIKTGQTVLTEQKKKIILNLQKEPTIIFSYLKELEKQKKSRDNFINRVILSLMEQYKGIDQLFLEVLFKITDPKLELIVLKWLKGIDLSDADLKQLNINESIDNDEIANRILNSLLMIINCPILFCLDQLETYSTRFEAENGVKILFDTLTNMYNRFQNLCILIMCLTDRWTEIQEKIERSALDRIQTKKNLAKLSFEDGILITESRLRLIYPPNLKLSYGTYPFSHDFIKQILNEIGFNPRKLLNRLSLELENMRTKKIITELSFYIEPHREIFREEERKIEPLDNFLQTELERLKTNIKEDKTGRYTFPIRQDFTRGILNEIFKEFISRQINLNGYQIKKIQINQKVSKKDIDITLKIEKESKLYDIGIEVNNSENMTSLYHVLQRLLKEIQNLKLIKVFLLRDIALTISPTAKKTNELLMELSPNGGLIEISEKDMIELMSIKKIIEKAGSQELINNDTIITRNNVLEFILPKRFLEISFISHIFNLITNKSQLNSIKELKFETPNSSEKQMSSEQKEIESPLNGVIKNSTLPRSIYNEPTSKNLTQLSKDLDETLEFFPKQISITPQETISNQDRDDYEDYQSIQKVSLKGTILQIIRKQPFYNLRKLEKSLQNVNSLQIREIINSMANEQMITIIYDKEGDLLFSIHPKFI